MPPCATARTSSYSAIAGPLGAGGTKGGTADGTGAVVIGVLRVDRGALVLHEIHDKTSETTASKSREKNLQHRGRTVDLRGEPMPKPHSCPLAAVLACFALVATVAPDIASAAPGLPDQPADSENDAELTPVHLSIAGPEADPELAGLLQAPVEGLLAARGYRVEPSAPRGIFLIVHVDETAPDTHELEVRLERDGHTTFYPTTRCTRCGSTDLIDTIGRTLEPAFDALDAVGPTPAPAEVDEVDEKHEGEVIEVEEPPPAQTDKDRLGTKGIAGVALLSTGLTVTAAGAALWASKESDHPTDPAMILRLRPPGITMVALGGVATVSGVVLLVLDRKEARERRTGAAPLLGPGLAGFSVAGRF